MPQVSIKVLVEGQDEPLSVRVPDEAPISSLLPVLVNRLGLPSADDPGAYLLVRETGQSLELGQSLRVVGVASDELLHLRSPSKTLEPGRLKLMGVVVVAALVAVLVSSAAVFWLGGAFNDASAKPQQEEQVQTSASQPIPSAQVPTAVPATAPVQRVVMGSPCADGSARCAVRFTVGPFDFLPGRLRINFTLDVMAPAETQAHWENDVDAHNRMISRGERGIHIVTNAGGRERVLLFLSAGGVANESGPLSPRSYSGWWEFQVSEPPGTVLTFVYPDFDPVLITVPSR